MTADLHFGRDFLRAGTKGSILLGLPACSRVHDRFFFSKHLVLDSLLSTLYATVSIARVDIKNETIPYEKY